MCVDGFNHISTGPNGKCFLSPAIGAGEASIADSSWPTWAATGSADCWCPPAEFYVTASRMQSSCSSFAVLVSLLGCFLAICCGLLCFLAVRLQRALTSQKHESLDDAIYRHMRRFEQERERVRQLHNENLDNPDYTDTSTISAVSEEL